MKLTANEEMAVQNIPLTALLPSPFNPRGKHSEDPEKFKDFTADIKARGVQQAILVRPDGGGKFQVVFGERRVKASKAAGLETVPAMVRELNDDQAREACIVENLHRADLHYLDEAKGFKQLLDTGLTQTQVAERVGKHQVYIALRLALVNLDKKWTEAAYNGRLNLRGALDICRITQTAQAEAWKELSQRHEKDDQFSVREIERFISESVLVSLAKAPFELEDAALVPKAGACTNCPKRSGASPLLFPDIKKSDTCTDSNCYYAKCDAVVALVKKEFPDAVDIVGENSDISWEIEQQLKKDGVLFPNEYGESGYKESKKDECEFTKQGVHVAGRRLGQVEFICPNPKCPVHGSRRGSSMPKSKPGVLNKERAEQVEKLWERQKGHAVRVALHAAVHEVNKDKTFQAVPIEVFRFIVKECISHINPQSDGVAYFEQLWPLSAKAKKDDAFGRGGIYAAADEAKDRGIPCWRS